MIIRPPFVHEASALSELARRSKAHWGYGHKLMEKWETNGVFTITPNVCISGLVKVGENEGRLVGWYRLSGEAPDGKLSDLWVDPADIGTGAGKKLLHTATEHAQELGFTALRIHSDPNAEGFYAHFGAEKIGMTDPDPVTGRSIPILLLPLTSVILSSDVITR
jgi:GNAT superfamily N-acetyltransferase